MARYITVEDALKTLKHLAYETALNQHDPYVADVFEDIAKNRLETWVDLIPTAQIDLSDYSDRLWQAAYGRGKAEAEVKHGKWTYDGVKRICPFCKDFIVTGRSTVKYCWNCGTRLKERSEDE